MTVMLFGTVGGAVFGVGSRESRSLLTLPDCYQPLYLAAENEHGF
jgi:hypothetical protein